MISSTLKKLSHSFTPTSLSCIKAADLAAVKTAEVCKTTLMLPVAEARPFRAIYYDLETTGLLPDCRTVEIAAFDPLEQRSFSSLINPGIPIPAHASMIHKITDKMVSEAPSFPQVAEQFLAFCPKHAVLIAHNNDAFDRPVLEQDFKRFGIEFPAFRFIDTLKWARKQRPDLPGHSLEFLRTTYGFPAHQAHRALEDVLMLQKVFLALSGEFSAEEVFEQLNEQPDYSLMPFGKHRGKPLEEVPKSYVSWLSSTGFFEQSQNTAIKMRFIELGML